MGRGGPRPSRVRVDVSAKRSDRPLIENVFLRLRPNLDHDHYLPLFSPSIYLQPTKWVFFAFSTFLQSLW